MSKLITTLFLCALLAPSWQNEDKKLDDVRADDDRKDGLDDKAGDKPKLLAGRGRSFIIQPLQFSPSRSSDYDYYHQRRYGGRRYDYGSYEPSDDSYEPTYYRQRYIQHRAMAFDPYDNNHAVDEAGAEDYNRQVNAVPVAAESDDATLDNSDNRYRPFATRYHRQYYDDNPYRYGYNDGYGNQNQYQDDDLHDLVSKAELLINRILSVLPQRRSLQYGLRLGTRGYYDNSGIYHTSRRYFRYNSQLRNMDDGPTKDVGYDDPRYQDQVRNDDGPKGAEDDLGKHL